MRLGLCQQVLGVVSGPQQRRFKLPLDVKNVGMLATTTIHHCFSHTIPPEYELGFDLICERIYFPGAHTPLDEVLSGWQPRTEH